MTKKEIIEKIAKAAVFGNLGLFVGAGFSKAVVNGYHAVNRPLSWLELLKRLCDDNGIVWDCIDTACKSYPEIATQICKKIMEAKNADCREADCKIKNDVCKLMSYYPDAQSRKKFRDLLLKISPQWIITTNYDLILEHLLAANARSLGPEEHLILSRESIPVYHLHGVKNDPDSIILTNEDYIKLFRPNDYRLQKLSLTLTESTTLFIGYSIGDQNVLTALDWSKNIYKNDNCYTDSIQLLFDNNPDDTVEENQGLYLIKTNSIEDVLTDIKNAIEDINKKNQKNIDKCNEIIDILSEYSESSLMLFVEEAQNREVLLKEVSLNYKSLIEPFILFLSKVFDLCWERAKPYGAFHAYAEIVTVILDIFIMIPYEKMPIVLFEQLASQLSVVAPYVGYAKGESVKAARIWDDNKADIPQDTKNELLNYARLRLRNSMERLIG